MHTNIYTIYIHIYCLLCYPKTSRKQLEIKNKTFWIVYVEVVYLKSVLCSICEKSIRVNDDVIKYTIQRWVSFCQCVYVSVDGYADVEVSDLQNLVIILWNNWCGNRRLETKDLRCEHANVRARSMCVLSLLVGSTFWLIRIF